MTQKTEKRLGYLDCYVGSNIYPFDKLFKGKPINILTEGFAGVDAILLWGGEDIFPSYYGEKAHSASQVRLASKPSPRDEREWKAMVYAKAHGIPIIGVCRGAQFLCAFAGGHLAQHVRGHNGGKHPVLCRAVEGDGEVWHHTTSAHHQMMYPFDVEHEMLACVDGHLSAVHESGPGAKELDFNEYPEPEVVYFPRVRGFAIQGHPEWMGYEDPFVEWCMGSIAKHCFQEKYVIPEEQTCIT